MLCIDALVSEEEFIRRYEGRAVRFYVLTPVDDSTPAWNLRGQVVEVAAPVSVTVRELKDMVAAQLTDGGGGGGLTGNKLQVKEAVCGFLKDANTMASYNIGDGARLELSLRSRGGKR